jgi:hypothetical protein
MATKRFITKREDCCDQTLAMSQLIFPLSMTFAPEWVVKEAEKIFFSFLWNNKKTR